MASQLPFASEPFHAGSGEIFATLSKSEARAVMSPAAFEAPMFCLIHFWSGQGFSLLPHVASSAEALGAAATAAAPSITAVTRPQAHRPFIVGPPGRAAPAYHSLRSPSDEER